MKRTKLERKKALNRTGRLQRRKRIRSRNAKRRARTFARNFGERAAAVRLMPCVVARIWSPPLWNETGRPRCFGDVQAAHARARGMGGAKGDRRELVPLCGHHHAEAGEYRTSQRAEFEDRYSVDLIAEAERIAVDLDAQGYP